MSLEKFNELVEKIDHAIQTIQKLKNENKEYKNNLENNRTEIQELKAENENLLESLENANQENKKLLEMHHKLEEKIEEILRFLPEESSEINVEENQKLQSEENYTDSAIIENSAEEKEEDHIKQVMDEPESYENKNLFTSDSDDELENSNTQTVIEDGIDEEDDVELNFDDNSDENVTLDDFDEKEDENMDLKFEESLLDDEKEDVDFYISDSKKNDNLPKGVL